MKKLMEEREQDGMKPLGFEPMYRDLRDGPESPQKVSKREWHEGKFY